LFPGLDVAYINDLIRAMAEEKGWDPESLWTGLHNLRHGKAAETLQKGIEAVRQVGGWKSGVAETRYGMQIRKAPSGGAKRR
jgi:hypothetical protein